MTDRAITCIAVITIGSLLAVIDARQPGSGFITGAVVLGLLWVCPNGRRV